MKSRLNAALQPHLNRQIECDCRDGGCDCQSRLIPYKSYLDHLSGFHEAKTVEDKTMCIQCDIGSSKLRAKSGINLREVT